LKKSDSNTMLRPSDGIKIWDDLSPLTPRGGNHTSSSTNPCLLFSTPRSTSASRAARRCRRSLSEAVSHLELIWRPAQYILLPVSIHRRPEPLSLVLLAGRWHALSAAASPLPRPPSTFLTKLDPSSNVKKELPDVDAVRFFER